MKRWLKAVRGFCAEDLREAARRFDRILLRKCFNCDSRRNPLYLLAIARTVRDGRKPLLERRRRERLECEKRAAAIKAAQDQERRRAENPESASRRALELARVAFENSGFGLNIAGIWLDQALQSLARRGADAYRLSTERLVELAQIAPVRRWLEERIAKYLPPPRPLSEDLRI